MSLGLDIRQAERMAEDNVRADYVRKLMRIPTIDLILALNAIQDDDSKNAIEGELFRRGNDIVELFDL